MALQRPATLIPASFGAILMTLAILGRKPTLHRAIDQASGAVMIFGLLSTLLTLGRALRVVLGMESEAKPEVWPVAAMSVLCGIYVSVALRNLIRSRAGKMVAVILMLVTTHAVSMAQPSMVKSAKATKGYALKAGATFYVDPSLWKKSAVKSASVSDVEFKHRDGTASVMVFSQKDFIGVDYFIDSFLEGMADSSRTITPGERTTRIINGTQVTIMKIDMVEDDVKITYLAGFYGGRKGMVQVLCFCASDIFEEYRPEFETVINGLVVKK